MSAPEDPTRPVVPGSTPVERVVETTEVDPRNDRVALVADDLRSLRTALVIVGILAAVAAGLAVWNLLEGSDDDEGRDGLRARQAQFDRRVSELERRQSGASEESDVTRLEQRLERAVGRAERAGRGASTAREASDQLRGRLADLAETNTTLSERIEVLERARARDDPDDSER